MRGLFIGIGGTGDEILAQLKDKVYASLGEIPETLQFRLIDTEAEDYRKNKGARLGGEGSETAISGAEYLQLKDDPPGTFYKITHEIAEYHQAHPEMARWYRAELFQQNLPQADFNLVRGAGQHRQFARMGLFLNKERLVNLLRKALSRCQGMQAEVPIWIVGSVAGGTGAGLFMDLALLARWVAEDMGVRKRVIGACILPEVFNNINIDPARAYAVLREMQRFQAPVSSALTGRADGKSFRFSVTYDPGMTVHLSGPLFDNLVFYNRRCESEEQRKSYFSEIADGLNLLLDESAGDQLFREWINVEEGYAASFNSYRIFLPARLYRRQFVLQAAIQLAENLLPRDARQVLEVGSADDRREEAVRILSGEIYNLFGTLLMRKPERANQPPTDTEFAELSQEMNAEYMINTMLGFANPVGVFGQDIGPAREQAAARLHANIFGSIHCADHPNVKEDFEDSKKRVKNEVINQRRQYDGDGKDSFATSLKAVRELVENHIREMVDVGARKYLGRYRANEQALGRANRVFTEIRDQLVQVRTHLQRLVEQDRSERERRKGLETTALVAMEQTPKRLFGGKSQLAEQQRDYLAAAYQVVQWEQREKLTAFLLELITVADQRFDHWLKGLQDWQQAIDHVLNLSRNENNDILQRLERQTKIQSAALGLKNTKDMDGYQEVLRDKCLLDPTTGESVVTGVLQRLGWQPGPRPQDLLLAGWPDREQGLTVQDFATALNAFLEQHIGKRMDIFEGMANYLEWLRDVKRDNIVLLTESLKRVTAGFVDARPTSESRRFLFLHGDVWDAEKHNRSPSAFDGVYNELSQDANFTGMIQHNLEGPDGVNLFRDRNVIAALMMDNKIPYSKIPIIANDMRPAYLNERDKDNPPWRAQTYHLFRCDQEAWKIECEQVRATGDRHYPLIPGQYTRLLDEPERAELFAKALATRVIREQDLGLDGKVWVCGPEEDDRRAIYLNDPGDPNDRRDLHRALITFVLDQGDRRRNQRARLDLRQVRGWIEEYLKQPQRTLKQAIARFQELNGDWFNVSIEALDEDRPEERSGQSEALRTQAFLGLFLRYYLLRP